MRMYECTYGCICKTSHPFWPCANTAKNSLDINYHYGRFHYIFGGTKSHVVLVIHCFTTDGPRESPT